MTIDAITATVAEQILISDGPEDAEAIRALLVAMLDAQGIVCSDCLIDLLFRTVILQADSDLISA